MYGVVVSGAAPLLHSLRQRLLLSLAVPPASFSLF
jgi:hypothetical protein